MGYRIPFGAQVPYMPSEKVRKRLPRWDGSTILGIFVGWEMKTGCRWNGAYLLIPKSILQTWRKGKKIHCDSVREIVWNKESEKDIIFPFREAQDNKERTVALEIGDDDMIKLESILAGEADTHGEEVV